MGLRDEQGMMAIGVALMLIVVLSLFGGVLWQYSMAEMKRVERTERDLEALFLAKAGAEAVMAAWIEAPHNAKPEGAADRIYFNSQTGLFQSYEPEECLGYVDVTVTKINDPGNERDQLTEIVSTAFVGGVSRQVKVSSYPHLFGHDDSLKWYNEQTGFVSNAEFEVPDELVIVRSQRPIRFNYNEPPPMIGFTAPIILFETPLDFRFNQDTNVAPILVSDIKYRLLVSAETIFFDDIFLLYLPKGRFTPPSVRFTVVLKLPSEESGISGYEIPGADANARYGRVYFDGNIVATQNYKWRWFILWYTERNGNPVPLITAEKKSLVGRAFYFRDGTDLSDIGPKDLIPMEDEGQRRNELRTIKPFIWE